jgi:hypothetical protein
LVWLNQSKHGKRNRPGLYPLSPNPILPTLLPFVHSCIDASIVCSPFCRKIPVRGMAILMFATAHLGWLQSSSYQPASLNSFDQRLEATKRPDVLPKEYSPVDTA